MVQTCVSSAACMRVLTEHMHKYQLPLNKLLLPMIECMLQLQSVKFQVRMALKKCQIMVSLVTKK